MNDALRLIGGDLVRALSGAAMTPAVDQAVRRRAEEVARAVRDGTGDGVRVLRRGSGAYAVSVEGQGLFAREFGSVAAPAEPAIAQAIAEMKR